MNWTAFQTGVKDAYAQGADGTDLGYAAVAAYVKGMICREVDSDLPLSKSYLNTYKELKAQIAGTLVPVFATTKPEVLVRLTVDADRAAISSYIDKLIAEAIADINGMATVFDKYLADFAIDLQRHVICFTEDQQDTYAKADVVTTGGISKITIPDGARITQVLYSKLAEPLEEFAEYIVGELVESNGRVYEVSIAGTLGDPEGGLVSIDGEDEELSGVTFRFVENVAYVEVSPVKWKDRMSLQGGTACAGSAVYTINPHGTEMWIYPALTSDDYQIRIFWTGLKRSFIGTDIITFDESCYLAGAEYVRMMIAKNLLANERAFSTSMASYQMLLRRLWLDCQERNNAR